MSNQVGLMIIFRAKPGKFDALLAAAIPMMDVVNNEAGTIAYGFHKVTDDKDGAIAVYELYESAQAQQIHGESPAINALRSQLAELLRSPPERYPLEPIPGAKGLPFQP